MSEADAQVHFEPPRRRRRWLRVLGLLFIFAAGVVVGGGATLIVGVHHVQNMIHHPERAPRFMAERLKWRLDLSDAQTAQVRQILAERQAALQDIRRRIQPDVSAELQRAHDQIAAVLTPKQAERWDRTFENIRGIWLPPATTSTSPESRPHDPGMPTP